MPSRRHIVPYVIPGVIDLTGSDDEDCGIQDEIRRAEDNPLGKRGEVECSEMEYRQIQYNELQYNEIVYHEVKREKRALKRGSNT